MDDSQIRHAQWRGVRRLAEDVAAMWRYVHARTVARVAPRLKRRTPDHSAPFQRYLRRAVESQPEFSILQVGAFDGVSNDPVHDLIRTYPHVRAVLLEPQPAPFTELRRLWKDNPGVLPIQAALAGECGERPLFVIADAFSRLHPFPGQVASFSRGQYPGAGVLPALDFCRVLKRCPNAVAKRRKT